MPSDELAARCRRKRPAIPRKLEDGGTSIEEAARTLFATQGFAGTSIRDLARAAGVSSASIYNYASSKEELLWRVSVSLMHRLLGGAEVALSASSCPAAQLDHFVRAHVRYHASNPRPTRIGPQELQFLEPRHRREVAALRDRYERDIRDVVRRGAELGFFDASLERYAIFSVLESGYGVGVWYKPGGELSVDQLCTVYAALALRTVAFDDETHRRSCVDPDTCSIREVEPAR